MRKFTWPIFLCTVLLLFGIPVMAQEKPVSGTVLSDDDGTPLPGVTVTNTRTEKKTQTNGVGYYSLMAQNGDQLRFTYVSYAAQTATVQGDKVNVRLVASNQELGNVVITGYGQARNKRELAYQSPTVKGEDIAQTRRDNFLNALAGRVPGLTVTSTSGLPGASAQIILRGGTSIGGNNQPLFVVDGVPLSNGGLEQESLATASSVTGSAANLSFANRNSDYTNRIADINPEDIESITVLKGPEATSVYGSDGAGGAIVITTKKGATGRTKITYSNSFTTSKVYRFPDIQTTYSRGVNGIYDPASVGAYGYYFYGPKYPAGIKLYDNIHNFFENGFSQQHNITTEAGTADLNYRLSAGYLNNGGVVPNTKLERINFRLTAFARLSKRLTLNSTWSYVNSKNDKALKGAGTYYTNLITFPQDIDASDYINPDGTRKLVRNVLPSSELNSPYWDVNKNIAWDKTDNMTGNIQLNANLVKGLTATGIIGINQFTQQGLLMYHPQSREAYSLNGFLSTYEWAYRTVNGTLRLNYRKTIAKKFSNDFYLGGYFEDNNSVTNSQKGEQFLERDFISINNTAPTSRGAVLAQSDVRKIRAFAGYTFGFDNILYVTLTGTREGVSTLTSKFRNTQPFFNYGSASASYILSDMDFMKPVSRWLSYAKLRASFATTGKGPIRPYIIDYSFQSSTGTGGGYNLGVTGNNFDLKPEFSQNMEVGGEFKFFNNKLGVDVAYFNNKVKDAIIAQRLSYGTGFILKYINGGRLSAQGWEVQLTAAPVKSKNFTWNTIVNFDKARTVVEAIPANVPYYYDSDASVFGSVRSQVSVGQSLAALAGYTFLKNNNGDLLISPTTGLPIQSITDFVPIGDRTPDFKIGLINSLTVKDFFLSFNLDVRKGGDVFNANEMFMSINGVSARTLDREIPRVIKGILQDGLENSQTPTVNTIAITPYFRSSYYNTFFAESDFIEKVNWVRMRDLTIGYQLPAKLLKRQKLFQSFSIYATGTDLFLLTNYSGMDPNVNALNSSNAKGYGGAGIDYGSIPTPRSLNFGIKASF